MMVFLFPGWLMALPPVVAFAGWSLFSGRSRRLRVSAVWLWRGLGEEGGGRGRRVDPAWACVALAAVLAAVALARPVWRSGSAAEWVTPEWSVRSTGPRTEAWVRVGEEVDRRGLEVVHGDAATRVGLGEGVAIDYGPADSAGDTKFLELMRGERIIGGAEFRRPVAGAFGILEVGTIDPALRRVFAVQGGGGPAAGARVVLADARSFTLADAAGARLCVVEGEASLEGVTVEGAVDVDGRPEGMDLASFVDVSGVRVGRMVRARLSGEWQVKMRVGSWPWVAERVGADGGRVVWLASRPSGESDWANDRSFVIYFSEVLRRTIPAGGDGGAVEWERVDDPAPAAVGEVSLWPGMGIGATGLLMGAMGMLWHRGR